MGTDIEGESCHRPVIQRKIRTLVVKGKSEWCRRRTTSIRGTRVKERVYGDWIVGGGGVVGGGGGFCWGGGGGGGGGVWVKVREKRVYALRSQLWGSRRRR